MTELRLLSIRCSGLMTEAELNKDLTKEEIADFVRKREGGGQQMTTEKVIAEKESTEG